eukprot:gene6075-7568_t
METINNSNIDKSISNLEISESNNIDSSNNSCSKEFHNNNFSMEEDEIIQQRISEIKSIESTRASLVSLNMYLEKLESDYSAIERNYKNYKILIDRLYKNLKQNPSPSEVALIFDSS